MRKGGFEEIDPTWISLPVRPGNTKSEERTYKAGDAIIVPGQKVDRLYQLLAGSIDTVRDLGAPNETRTTYSRLQSEDWTPVLGGRYLFAAQQSNMHYLATSDCSVIVIGQSIVHRLYESGQIVNLVRELIRCSDMPLGDARMELMAWYTLTGFPGFDIEDSRHLLRHDPSRMRVKNDDDLKAIEREFIQFARHMMKCWMGDWVPPEDAESTSVELAPQPSL